MKSQFHNNYNLVQIASQEEFEKKKVALKTKHSNSGISDDTVKAVERLLDVQPGTISLGRDDGFTSYNCVCGHTVTFYDFVFSALVDADHSKSFILHTILGNKPIIQHQKHPTRCSACGRIGQSKDHKGMIFAEYWPTNYMCEY